jgi:hypothetical protein
MTTKTLTRVEITYYAKAFIALNYEDHNHEIMELLQAQSDNKQNLFWKIVDASKNN